jgi:homocysteine S-methyltransferase
VSPIAGILAREPFVLLDGGLASELMARGHDLDDPLWSARVLLDDPAAIAAVHRDYFAAGADVATTASYQAGLPGLRARGLSVDEARAVLRRSVELARTEADRVVPQRLVVASLGSYGATVPGGVEYTGAFGPIDDDALVAFHAERLAILADGADIVAFETIPSLREAQVIARVLERAQPPCAWVAFTCRDAAHTGSGDRLVDCVAALAHAPGLAAIGINCTQPSIVEDALVEIGRATALPRVAYPNAGEAWAGGHFRGTRTDPGAFTALARRWWTAGARLLGGCCRTTPAHVAALAGLRDELRAALGSRARP